MSTSPRRLHYTYAQYLSLEEESSVRHEYLGGRDLRHGRRLALSRRPAAACIGALRGQMPPGCRAFTSDLRVRIAATGLTTYPDAAVVCGGTLRAAEDPLAVTNPVLLVEVTSPSTEDYDRGEKLRHYNSLPSVREVLIVSHRAPHLALHCRGDADWTATTAETGAVLELSSVRLDRADGEVYRDGLEDAS